MFWLIIVFLCALLAALLAAPILRRKPGSGADDRGAGLRARLDRIRQDRDAGLIDAAAADRAEIEAKRGVLNRSENAAGAPGGARRTRVAALAFAGAAPLAALWLYFTLGAPALIGAPPPVLAVGDPAAAIAAMAPEDRAAMIETMVAGLAARLENEPDDIEGWRMLAQSYAVLGRPEAGAAAYRELLKRVDGDSEDWRGFAGVLIALGPEAGRAAELDAAMAKLQAIDPDDPLALYFLGVRAREAGDNQRAAALWRRLRAILPADAPVIPELDAMIADASEGAAEPR